MASNMLTGDALSLFLDITKKINSHVDREVLLDDITESCKALLKSEFSSILLLDETREELFFSHVSLNTSGKLKEMRFPVGTGIAGTVAKSGKPIIVNDPHDARIYRKVDNLTSVETRNLLCVPLFIKNKIIGVIEVMNHIGKEKFDQSDQDLLLLFAEYAAIAINNRELFKSCSLKMRQFSASYDISNIVTYNPFWDELLKKTVDVIENYLSTDRISIILLDEVTDEFKFAYGTNISKEVLKRGVITVEKNVLAEIKKNKSGLFCNDIEFDERFGINKKPVSYTHL
ncbi:MAG: GAF domain-containing protein, partial [Alphaproteobacteria bacterium]|nr:GAF domain-containing protein [Alphaproteobacteria bacterium]